MLRRPVRSIAAAALLSLAGFVSPLVRGAQAQLGRARVSNAEPGYWVGLAIGYVDGISMSDNASGSVWNFGSSTQIRATLEKRLDPGVTAGIAAGFSTAPLTYTPSTPPPGASDCAVGCQANADVTQYTVFVRGGGGVGFHGLYGIEGGVTRFSNFREEGTSTALPPANGSYDITFAFGGGFAYGLSNTADIYASESLEFILHKQLSTTTSSAPRVSIFRGGIRFGF